MGKPDFLIIGETKCGTTSMFNYLIRHPQILDTYGNGNTYDEIYATKEIRFFDRYYNKGLDWYFSRFPEKAAGEITGEATPMYMYRTLAAQRIKQDLPDVKLIVMLRNPVDRLISNFQHNYKWVPGWKDTYPSLENYFNSCSDRDYYLIEKGLYYSTIKKWLNYFPLEQFCIIKSEDVFTKPGESYQRVIKYLGLPHFSLDDYPVLRANEYEQISNELRTNLERFYRPFNKKLEKLLNQKFDWNE